MRNLSPLLLSCEVQNIVLDVIYVVMSMAYLMVMYDEASSH